MQNFDLARQGQRAKGAQEGFVSLWNVPGANAIFDLAKRWQRAKAARRVLGPWWNVLRAGFETLLNAEFRPGNAGAKGERCTGGFRVLVKRAWRRCGNRLNAIFDLAKRCGKGLKLHGGFWGPGGTCFAQVLKPSKCSISTWQGRGKEWQGAKAARKGLGPWWKALAKG